jgi:rhodanese-related sulfurtransferase
LIEIAGMPKMIAILFLFYSSVLHAQFKNDNTLFKTIDPKDLCTVLDKTKDYLLLDVRSAGEFTDASANAVYNLGHLNGAVNIDINEMSKRIGELAAYKNKPVFVYCSHSQRSRRVSRMLADSGFTNVNNINGGMTAFYQTTGKEGDCLRGKIFSNNQYAILSPAAVCAELNGKKNVYLLDVRPDSVWDHTSSDVRMNSVGYLKGTHHISLVDLSSRIAEIPGGNEIVITDLFGSESALAAKQLKEKGFSKVSIMLEGMDRLLLSDAQAVSCIQSDYITTAPFRVMSNFQFARLRQEQKNMVVLDVRPDEEYANKSSLGYRNIGHIDKAIHLSLAGMPAGLASLDEYKGSPVIIYDFSGGTDAYKAADQLARNGFKNVFVLAGGLFNLRWTASNVPGMYFMHQWVKDVPEENR